MVVNRALIGVTVVITGGAGFLGQRLARRLVSDGHLALPDGTELIRPEVVLADCAGGPVPDDLAAETTLLSLDITNAKATAAALADAQAVFHLAAVVSGQAEADYDLGMAVNLDGTRNIVEALKGRSHPVPLVATSSVAVFGDNAPEPLSEATPTQPRTSYGAAKAMGELLMSDARRRGMIEARCLRLPTIIVRPGRPNAAASSFASSIFREPLNGETAICPVDPGIAMWVASPETAVDALVHAMRVPSGQWPSFSAVNVPGVSATVAEMLEALHDIGGAEARARVRLDPDPAIEAIAASWPAMFDTTIANALGFKGEGSMADIVQAYVLRMKK
jgi:nucleoside-diphosphate-sugar epimerase